MRHLARAIDSALAVPLGLGLAALLFPIAAAQAQTPTPSPTPIPIPRPTPMPAPTPDPGEPALRVVGSTTVARGATVEVDLDNGPGNRRDWIGLYWVGSPDIDSLRWKYLNGSNSPPARGLVRAAVRFTLPRLPGRYEFRFFRSGTHHRLATSRTVTVAVR